MERCLAPAADRKQMRSHRLASQLCVFVWKWFHCCYTSKEIHGTFSTNEQWQRGFKTHANISSFTIILYSFYCNGAGFICLLACASNSFCRLRSFRLHGFTLHVDVRLQNVFKYKSKAAVKYKTPGSPLALAVRFSEGSERHCGRRVSTSRCVITRLC